MSDTTKEPVCASKPARYAKDIPCVVPGCDKKFRPTTEYQVFLAHHQKKHGEAK